MGTQVGSKYFAFLFCLILPLQILNAQVVIKEQITLSESNKTNLQKDQWEDGVYASYHYYQITVEGYSICSGETKKLKLKFSSGSIRDLWGAEGEIFISEGQAYADLVQYGNKSDKITGILQDIYLEVVPALPEEYLMIKIEYYSASSGCVLFKMGKEESDTIEATINDNFAWTDDVDIIKAKFETSSIDYPVAPDAELCIQYGGAPSISITVAEGFFEFNKSDSVDHFDIQIANDQFAGANGTLAFTETATLFVKAKDPDGNDISLDENTSLKLSVLDNLNYLAFINTSGDTLKPADGILTGIPYKDLRDGKIKIAAVKNNPVISDTCRVRVEKESDAGINGEKKVTILEYGLEIEMNEPLAVWPRFTNNSADSCRKIFNLALSRGSSPVNNHKIKLFTKNIQGSGGHDHTNLRPVTEDNYGFFQKTISGTHFITLEDSIKQNGRIENLYFNSSIFGDTMVVYLQSLENKLLKDSVTIIERVSNLVLLPNSNLYVKVGGTNNHNGSTDATQINNENDHNHFGTQILVTALENISNQWHQENPNSTVLRINDMSLPLGGKFDVRGTWTGPHDTHRTGRQCDIRTDLYYYSEGTINHRIGVVVRSPETEPFNQVNGELNNNSRIVINRSFEEICSENNCNAHIHSPNSTNEHYHISLN